LRGTYRLHQEIGAGAFGTTYRATDLNSGRTVAIKEMLMRRANTMKHLELFEREARVLERLRNPGVPRYFADFVIEDGRNTAFYLVQEFIEGTTLEARDLGRPIRPTEAFERAAALLEILVYLHGFSPSVVHRDVKPANIMVRPNGQLVLIDFGSVRAALDTGEGGSTVAGTFGYMAPEQFMGRALPVTDVYGVGATLAALLSGGDPQALIGADRSIDTGKLRLEPRWLTVLDALLEPDPDRRPSARDALALIRRALDDPTSIAPGSALSAPSMAPRATPLVAADPRNAIEQPGPHHRRVILAMSVGLLVAGIIPVLFLSIRAPDPAWESPAELVAAVASESSADFLATAAVPTALGSSEATMDETQFRGPHVPVLGRADARVRVAVFSSYDCAHCSRLWNQLDELYTRYPNDLQLSTRHRPLRDRTVDVTLAAICVAEQGEFWAFHRRIHGDSSAHQAPLLSQLAGLNVDVAAVQTCVQSHAPRAALDLDRELGDALGVSGTPTIYLNGTRIPAGGIDQIRAALEGH